MLFSNFLSLSLRKLRTSICEMSEITSLSTTSLQFGVKEAPKCDNIPFTLPASLSCTRTKYKMAMKSGLTYENSFTDLQYLEMSQTWKKLTTGVRQLARLLFDNNLVNPGLVLQNTAVCGPPLFAQAKFDLELRQSEIDLLAILEESLDRALFLSIFIGEVRSSGVRASIAIVRIRKFYKM